MSASLNPQQRSFFLTEWELTQKPTTEQSSESKRFWSTRSYIGCLHQSQFLKANDGMGLKSNKNGGLATLIISGPLLHQYILQKVVVVDCAFVDERRRQKDCKSRRGWMTQENGGFLTQQDCCTHRDCGRMCETCTGLSQMGSQCWEMEVDMGPTSNQEVICNCYPLEEVNSFSSSVVSLCLSNTLQTLCPVVGQHKTNSTFSVNVLFHLSYFAL